MLSSFLFNFYKFFSHTGNFGCVHEGYLKGDNLDSIPKKVAVKTLLGNNIMLI